MRHATGINLCVRVLVDRSLVPCVALSLDEGALGGFVESFDAGCQINMKCLCLYSFFASSRRPASICIEAKLAPVGILP